MYFSYKHLAFHAYDPGLGLHGFAMPLRVQLLRCEVVRYSTELYGSFELAKDVEDGKQNDLERIPMVVLNGQLSCQHSQLQKSIWKRLRENVISRRWSLRRACSYSLPCTVIHVAFSRTNAGDIQASYTPSLIEPRGVLLTTSEDSEAVRRPRSSREIKP